MIFQGFLPNVLMQVKATMERTKMDVDWIKLSRCSVGMVTRGNETYKNETMGHLVSQVSCNPTLDLRRRRSIVNVPNYSRSRGFSNYCNWSSQIYINKKKQTRTEYILKFYFEKYKLLIYRRIFCFRLIFSN